jgi:hypothetical protein
MPPQIGQVISEAVYDNQLKSNPLHPITDKVLACHFIDIPGSEKRNLDTGSFKVHPLFSLYLASELMCI